MIVNYTNTRRDLLRFSRYAMVRSRAIWIMVGAMLLVLAPLNIAALDPAWAFPEKVLVFVAMEAMYAAIPIGILVILVLASTFVQRESLSKEHTIEVTDESLTESTDVNTGMVKWPGVKSVVRRADVIYVFVGPATAHLIPRRAVQSDEDWERLCNTILEAYRASRPGNAVRA